MASITVFSDVPGRAQNTCGASFWQVLDIVAGDPHGRLAVALGGRHQPLPVDLEARGLAPVEPDPAVAGGFEVAAVAHDVPGGQHRQRVHIGDEVAHIVVGGPEHDVLRRAGLDDAPALHDGDVVADLQRLFEVVADEDDRLLQRRLKLQELVLQLGADQRIERRERLVHQKDRRFGGEGARQADALLHAARQLMRVFLRPLVEADQLQLPVDPLLALGVRHAGKFQPEADILLDRAPGQQRELLEHHGDLSLADAAQRVGVAIGDVDHPVAGLDEDVAARRHVEQVDGAQAASTCRSRKGPSARKSRPRGR